MALNQVGLERLNTATTNKIGENKNLVINGQFDIWQRGTDSGSNTTDGVLACDRWVLASSGATKQVTRQTFTLGQTDVPSNPKYFLRYAVTTGNNNAGLRQRIEGVDRVQGAVTLTFYAKGTNPGGGTFNITNRQEFGTGGSASSPVDTGVGDFTVTTSWAKKTFTFTPPSISGKTLGTNNNDYYELEIFRQPAGDTSTAAYTIDIANVQLEVGSVSTDFEDRSHAEELALCQRYYFKMTADDGNNTMFGVGWANSANQCIGIIHFPQPLRDAPSAIETSGSASDYRVNEYGANHVATGGPTFSTATKNTSTVYFTVSSITAGRPMFLRANTNDAFLAWSAEL